MVLQKKMCPSIEVESEAIRYSHSTDWISVEDAKLVYKIAEENDVFTCGRSSDDTSGTAHAQGSALSCTEHVIIIDEASGSAAVS